eukprot:12429617-Karenia_brevis.AAC.1
MMVIRVVMSTMMMTIMRLEGVRAGASEFCTGPYQVKLTHILKLTHRHFAAAPDLEGMAAMPLTTPAHAHA